MSNGYKPAPLDLSDVKLTAGQEVLVDKLAENAHNVWAKDRIKQGWTYGIQQVRIIHYHYRNRHYTSMVFRYECALNNKFDIFLRFLPKVCV